MGIRIRRYETLVGVSPSPAASWPTRHGWKVRASGVSPSQVVAGERRLLQWSLQDLSGLSPAADRHRPIVTARLTTARASSIASVTKPLGRPRDQPVEGTGALGQVGREHLMARPQAQKWRVSPAPTSAASKSSTSPQRAQLWPFRERRVGWRRCAPARRPRRRGNSLGHRGGGVVTAGIRLRVCGVLLNRRVALGVFAEVTGLQGPVDAGSYPKPARGRRSSACRW